MPTRTTSPRVVRDETFTRIATEIILDGGDYMDVARRLGLTGRRVRERMRELGIDSRALRAQAQTDYVISEAEFLFACGEQPESIAARLIAQRCRKTEQSYSVWSMYQMLRRHGRDDLVERMRARIRDRGGPWTG